MAAAVHIAPASGSVISVVSACEVTVTGADANTSTGYDTDNYPASPAVTYYLKIAKSGSDPLISPVFTPASDGTAEWHDVIVPSSGSWTLTLNKTSDDSVAATAAVTVS